MRLLCSFFASTLSPLDGINLVRNCLCVSFVGDPRISTVNIIWINPGTTTWVQSPCSNRKGELAVEVTLEKEAVRQSGDAWRIVLDCCLPVFHLIDSQRSIPYAIKQIQDLFGISCAFDQAVQVLYECLYLNHP